MAKISTLLSLFYHELSMQTQPEGGRYNGFDEKDRYYGNRSSEL